MSPLLLLPTERSYPPLIGDNDGTKRATPRWQKSLHSWWLAFPKHCDPQIELRLRRYILVLLFPQSISRWVKLTQCAKARSCLSVSRFHPPVGLGTQIATSHMPCSARGFECRNAGSMPLEMGNATMRFVSSAGSSRNSRTSTPTHPLQCPLHGKRRPLATVPRSQQ